MSKVIQASELFKLSAMEVYFVLTVLKANDLTLNDVESIEFDNGAISFVLKAPVHYVSISGRFECRE